MAERIKNELDDFTINGKLSIKELYDLSVKDGFENRTLFFSIKNSKTGQHFSTEFVVDFGKGWSPDTAIIHLSWEEMPQQDCSPG
jgi:hypothetical protein